MSVIVRPYRNGGWEIDIRVVTPDGARHLRERKRAPISSRSAAMRWAEGRERVLFERLMVPAQDTPRKEAPTLRAFAPRFLDGHSRANRQKPSGIAAKEMILRCICCPRRVTGSSMRSRARTCNASRPISRRSRRRWTRRFGCSRSRRARRKWRRGPGTKNDQ